MNYDPFSASNLFLELQKCKKVVQDLVNGVIKTNEIITQLTQENERLKEVIADQKEQLNQQDDILNDHFRNI